MFHKLFYFTVIYFFRLIFKVFYRLKVYGKNHYLSGSAIIAPNHVSFLDPPIIAISCPGEIHFLARQTLFKSFFGKAISALNTHPVQKEATNLKVMKLVHQLLKAGHKVLLFPEGTRSRDNQLQEIKPGIGMLISKSECAIIPTYIHGTYEIWSRNRKLPKFFGKTAVVFGTPILWEDYADMDKKEAQELIAQRLSHSLKELRKWYEEGAHGIPP
ncbi:MAG: lysophospholipid acyltransferase family protein [Simkaniaceae bacterium]